MRRLSVILILFALLLAPWGQAYSGTTPAGAAPPDVSVQDPLGRDTPRGTVVGFIRAAQAQDFARAAEYLDVKLPTVRAQRLTQELKVVLDRGLNVNLNLLSAKPEGDPAASPKPDRQLIGTVSTETGGLDILLDRVQRGKSPPVWLFSSETLKRVPEVYAEIGPPWLESYLPTPLVENRVATYPLWVLIATLLGIPMALVIAKLLSRGLISLLRPLVRYLTKEQDDRQLERITGPIRLLMLVVAIHGIVMLFGLPLLVRQFWSRVALALAVIGMTWLLSRLIDILAELTHRHLDRQSRPHNATTVGLLRRLGKVMVMVAGALVILYAAGVNITAALAGLGVGGIAVAFAAQKTLENLFGGITITSDQPVRVGDFCRFGDQVGTVEDIGLRSTRIRTPDRTLVSVPNGHLSSISLENFGVRDKIWFHPTIQLRYETSADQLRYVLAEIRQMLYAHPRVESQSARIRFAKFGACSLDLEVFAYVQATDYAVFLEVQEDLLLRIMDIVETSGTSFAFPSHTAYVTQDRGLDAEKAQAAIAQVHQWREEREVPFPNFPPERIVEMTDTIPYPSPDSALRAKS
ncbi:MAG: mechanosensitive ion channel protein MscS [candidate division NC10 bacterium]|nr:mechanosensitive ion channel protein MscS [candidate division NC10 bacterium]